MMDTFDWPFFTDAHRTLEAELRSWSQRELSHPHAGADVDTECRALVKQLGSTRKNSSNKSSNKSRKRIS